MANQPGGRDLHVDRMLTEVSIGYRNLRYIADEIFPMLGVRKQSDLIPVHDKSAWFRDEAHIRAPGTESEGGGWTVSQTNYYCPRYSYRTEIHDEDRDNADDNWNLDADATEFVTDKLFLRRERNFGLSAFTTGKWGTDYTGVTNFAQWSDYGASDPAQDLAGWMDEVEVDIGREPNTLVIGKQAWMKLKFHPVLIDAIRYTQRGVLTDALIAELLDLDRVLVGRALYTADPEGTPEANVTYSRIWGKHALLAYVTPRPALRTATAGYTFVWQRVPNARQYIKRYRYETKEMDAIEANSYFDQRIISPEAGIFLSSVVA